MLCLCEVRVWIICVDGRSRYMCIVLGGYLQHLRCTQCSILLHHMDICFLICICLWQISQIQTRLFNVVRPGLVSTSPTFVSSSASHPAGQHDRHAHKTVNRAPLLGAGRFDTICTPAFVCCNRSTACRLCRLEPEWSVFSYQTIYPLPNPSPQKYTQLTLAPKYIFN